MQILHGLRLVYEDQNKAHATKVPMLSKMELNLDQLEIQLEKEKKRDVATKHKYSTPGSSHLLLEYTYLPIHIKHVLIRISSSSSSLKAIFTAP